MRFVDTHTHLEFFALKYKDGESVGVIM